MRNGSHNSYGISMRIYGAAGSTQPEPVAEPEPEREKENIADVTVLYILSSAWYHIGMAVYIVAAKQQQRGKCTKASWNRFV